MKEKSAFITIIGRPNVGKSSLMNRILGQKVAIVSDKPQTTRTKICGVYTKGVDQLVFIDTPGFHKPRNELDKNMNKDCRYEQKLSYHLYRCKREQNICPILHLSKQANME